MSETGGNSGNDKISIDRLLQYMNEKYPDDTFTFESVYGGYPGAEERQIYVVSEKLPGQLISVVGKTDGDGILAADNYLAVKYADEVNSAIRRVLTEAFGDNVFLFCGPHSPVIYDTLPADLTAEEFMKEPAAGILFTAIAGIDETELDKEKLETSLKNLLRERGICCSGKIFLDTDGYPVTSLTEENYSAQYLVPELYHTNLFFVMDSSLECAVCRWE